MKKYPSFKVDFLNCEIFVVFDKNWAEIARKILGRPLKSEEQGSLSNGVSIEDVGRKYYILAPTNVKDHVICHECMHILIWMAHAFGFELRLETQEYSAYLIEYLIDEVMKIKKRKK